MFHRNSFLPQLPIKILFSTLSLHSVLKLVLMIYSTWSRWSSSINGKLPGASMRNSARGKGHEEGGSAYAKVGSSLRRPPVSEHLPPKPQSAYFTALCSHLYLWLYGGLSPTTSLCKGVNLGLQIINLLGGTRVSQVKPLCWQTSLCDRIIHTLATTYMIVYNLSTINSTESLEYFESLS